MNLKDLNNLRADTEGRIKAVFLICMFVLVSAGGFAQNTKSISGTVREKGSNETVIGATVQVKGTHNGVITNENGEYTIKNVSPGQVLVFSMIGMNTVEKTVGSQNRIDVLMDAGVLIDEVVVTGYQTQRKVDLTGSVSSLSSDQFMQTNPLSLEQALKGKISGVQVMNNDGAPGGGITIKYQYFCEDDNYIIANRYLAYDIKINELCRIISYGANNLENPEIPFCYLYQNQNGQKFLVFNCNAKDCESLLKHHANAKIIADNTPWLSGESLPVFCYGNPNLYVQCKEDDECLIIGIWNFFEDEAIDPVLFLSRGYQSAEFLCGSGKLCSDQVYLEDIPPYAFRGIVLRK